MHSNSSPTIYCPCDLEQVILPLWASVSLSTKQGESWPQGLCGWWMERRCQVSDMARSRYQAPGRHLMTSGRYDFFFARAKSDGSLWLLGAFLDHIWTQEEGGLWSLCQGGGEDEQNAKFILSQIRYLLVDAHVWVSGGLAGISWLLPPLALVFCIPSQAQGLGLGGTAWQALLELKNILRKRVKKYRSTKHLS